MPALLAVGLEGFWGLVLSAVALPILGVVRGTDGLPLDSATQAFQVNSSVSGSPLSCNFIGHPDSLRFDNSVELACSVPLHRKLPNQSTCK